MLLLTTKPSAFKISVVDDHLYDESEWELFDGNPKLGSHLIEQFPFFS